MIVFIKNWMISRRTENIIINHCIE
uniref:Uncharacterized protein n=1 Tax=Rhizophora mucronata TaxID=61149 RepID=A0A2P2R1C5_RHIMU